MRRMTCWSSVCSLVRTPCTSNVLRLTTRFLNSTEPLLIGCATGAPPRPSKTCQCGIGLPWPSVCLHARGAGGRWAVRFAPAVEHGTR